MAARIKLIRFTSILFPLVVLVCMSRVCPCTEILLLPDDRGTAYCFESHRLGDRHGEAVLARVNAIPRGAGLEEDRASRRYDICCEGQTAERVSKTTVATARWAV